jgi:hypothetical protein
MLHRTIKAETGNKWRIYKFSNNEEYNTFLHDTEKYFKASTTILSSGAFRTSDMNFLKSLADDLAYQDLNLTSSDLFIITKENISLKISDEERKQRLIKRASAQIEKVNKSIWTPEELGFIWSDTVENIAKQLNKTESSINLQRKIFLSENTGFIIPEVAKKQRPKKEKVEKAEKAPKVKNNEWTANQLALLWSKPAMMLAQEIGKNYREIVRRRVEWCLSDPKFIIPNVSQFNSKGLPNKVERKRRSDGWTEEQENLIWEDTIENLVSVLNRTYGSIYGKRQDFLEKNPGFIIPECAKTIRKKNISHPIEKIKSDTPTLFDKAIEKATEVKKKRSYNKMSKETSIQDNMKNVAEFLKQLPSMPKKIKINGIELEF